jgi:cell division protein ZapA (FtsZ GTPase activity inhibitor)
MSESRRLELTLLGQTLSLKTEAPPDYVRSLGRYLESRVESIRRSGVQDTPRAIMLAALDIIDELFRIREDRERQAGDVGARLGVLVSLLEKATPRDSR